MGISLFPIKIFQNWIEHERIVIIMTKAN